MPSKLVDLDLDTTLTAVWGLEGYDHVIGLVRHAGEPLGWIHTPSHRQPALTVERLEEVLQQQLPWSLLRCLLAHPTETEQAVPPAISIVVMATRTDWLERCLASLLAQDYPEFEILVVLQGASVSAIPHAHDPRVRYVTASRPGPEPARQPGAREARHELLAFISEQARADRYWLRAVARAFRSADVAAVTGAVVPAEMETEAQTAFEQGGYGLGRGLQRRVFRRELLTDSDLFWANGFGSAANLAVRRSVFERVGFRAWIGDDAVSGGEMALLHRLVASGETVVYEPASLVWFTSVRDGRAVRRLAYQAGRMFAEYVMFCFRERTIGRGPLVRSVCVDWVGRHLMGRLWRPGQAGRRMVLAEIGGAAAGLGRGLATWPTARSVSTPPDIAIPRNDAVSDHAPAPAPSTALVSIYVVRTWYPHWGGHSGINQYLQHLAPDRFRVETDRVREGDDDFPVRSRAVRSWLRYWVQRQDMAWYSLSDLCAELRALQRCWVRRPHLIHFLDGEHGAQFLPQMRRSLRPPRLLATFHQPPAVLDRVIRKDVLTGFDRIVVVAPEQEEFFRSHVPADRLRLILHGIDTEYFQPSADKIHGDRLTCVTVGHNYRDYRVVRVVAQAVRDDSRIRFHVVSPRPTGLEDLRNVMVQRGLSDDDLRRLYQQADLLFMPLSHATANNALLEGIACGLPVLSTALPGVHAYVPGNEALLIAGNKPDEFVSAIQSLRRDPDRRRAMGEAARRRAETLSWSRIAPQYEALYADAAR